MAEAVSVQPVPSLSSTSGPSSSLGPCDWVLANGTGAGGTELYKAPHATSALSSPTPLAEFKKDHDMRVQQNELYAKPLGM